MGKYYSKSTGGFYSLDIHGDKIPSDAVEVTEDLHRQLMDGQMAGNEIVPDKNGRPVLLAQKKPDDIQLAARARAERTDKLYSCDWTVLPDVPMNEKTRVEWITYRQALRDVPLQPTFPQKIDWPTPPKSVKKEK